MTGPASPAKDLPAWLRAAYGKPLTTVCVRDVVDTAPDGTSVTCTYETPYYTALELRQEAIDWRREQNIPWTAPAWNQLAYIDHRNHTIVVTYTDTENQP